MKKLMDLWAARNCIDFVSKAQRTEWEIHFHPFQAAIRAGALSATLQNANKMMTMPGS